VPKCEGIVLELGAPVEGGTGGFPQGLGGHCFVVMSKRIKREVPSIALLCSREGLITQVLHAGLGLAEPLVGADFCTLLKPGSIDKGRKFLKAIQAKRGVDGWQMDVLAKGGVYRLYFAGLLEDNQFAIVGVPTPIPVAVTSLLRELLAGRNNGEVAEIAVRALLDEKSGGERDSQLRQLTRVNNQLVSEQRDLINKNLDLARRMEANALLLRSATHDLRQPIGAILVYSELLMEDAVETMDVESREFVHGIHASTEFLLRLLDDVVDFSADEVAVPQRVESASLMQIIQHGLLLSCPLAERKRAKLVLRHKGAVPTVKADAPKLAKVFNKLIEYTLQHSRSSAEIEVHVVLKHKTALVSVRAEGSHIRPDEIPDVFAPFQKSRTRETAGEPSTGLGLAIAKRIVEWHGGQLEMKMNDRMGAAFYVSLPSTPEVPVARSANILQPCKS
jgi:two-component system sensor histidine kinase/response regulator